MKLTITEEMVLAAVKELKNAGTNVGSALFNCCPVAQCLRHMGHNGVTAGTNVCFIGDVCYRYSEKLRDQVEAFDIGNYFEPGDYELLDW